MQRRIFGPLGMTRTSLVWEKRFDLDFADGYDEQGKPLGAEHWHRADAAGSMQTTLRDYSRFVSVVLNGDLLDQTSRSQMLNPQVPILSKHEFLSLNPETTTENQPIRLSYGLGWGLYWSPHGEALFKEGHDDGWRSYVACFDRPKTAILIMTNSSNGEDIYSGLLEELLGDSYTPLAWEGFKPAPTSHP